MIQYRKDSDDGEDNLQRDFERVEVRVPGNCVQTKLNLARCQLR